MVLVRWAVAAGRCGRVGRLRVRARGLVAVHGDGGGDGGAPAVGAGLDTQMGGEVAGEPEAAAAVGGGRVGLGGPGAGIGDAGSAVANTSTLVSTIGSSLELAAFCWTAGYDDARPAPAASPDRCHPADDRGRQWMTDATGGTRAVGTAI